MIMPAPAPAPLGRMMMRRPDPTQILWVETCMLGRKRQAQAPTAAPAVPAQVAPVRRRAQPAVPNAYSSQPRPQPRPRPRPRRGGHVPRALVSAHPSILTPRSAHTCFSPMRFSGRPPNTNNDTTLPWFMTTAGKRPGLVSYGGSHYI